MKNTKPNRDITAEIDEFVFRHNKLLAIERIGINTDEQKELHEMFEQALTRQRKADIQKMVELSDKIELQGNTTLEEWKAFKRFRNTMRDEIK